MKPGISPKGGETIILEGPEEVDTFYVVVDSLHKLANDRVQTGIVRRRDGLVVTLTTVLLAWLKLARDDLAGRPALEFVRLSDRSNSIRLTLDKTGSNSDFSLRGEGNQAECHIADPEGVVLGLLRDTSDISLGPEVQAKFADMLTRYDSHQTD